MATKPSEVPTSDAPAGVNPAPLTIEQATALARLVSEDHRAGKQAKRLRDLTAEKYMLHVHGEGLAQWMDVINGQRVDMTPNLDGSPRAQSNLLRPIVDDFVSYQTSIPYQVLAEARADRASRDRAKIDTIWANNTIQTQRLNELVAEAEYIACVYGHGIVRAAWRQDIPDDLYDTPWGINGILPGYIDLEGGDPWATVYNPLATRRSVRWTSYEKTFPLDVIKQGFKTVPGVEKLRGRKDMPSSSRFQRTARRWQTMSTGQYGTAALTRGTGGSDEAIALICREDAPGILPEWPRGRLVIIALDGTAEVEEGSWGAPTLLYVGPLPGGRFSGVRFYSTDCYDDVYGKPFVADLDDLQIRRNQLESLLIDGGRRAARPPMSVGPNSIEDDTAVFEPDALVESLGGTAPQFLRYPTEWMSSIQQQIENIEAQMFRIGGWQAASRGESNAGDPAAKVVSLQRADDTGKGPANRGIQGSICEVLQVCHALTKEYAGALPLPVRVAGADYGYLKSSYVYANQLSDEAPNFRVVSGFASTPEARAQQLLQLNQMVGGDGMPILTTKQLRKAFPDGSIWPNATDIEEVQDRRIQARNEAIRDAVREATSDPMLQQMPPEWQQMQMQALPQQIAAQVLQKFPVLRDDPVEKHIEGLSELTQDPAEDPTVAQVAVLVQEQYYGRQAEMAQAQMAAQAQATGAGAPADAGRGEAQARASQAPQTAESEVNSLTRQAQGMS